MATTGGVTLPVSCLAEAVWPGKIKAQIVSQSAGKCWRGSFEIHVKAFLFAFVFLLINPEVAAAAQNEF